MVNEDRPRIQTPKVQIPSVQRPSQEAVQLDGALHSSSIATGLQAFPSELVEQTRARIRAGSRQLQRCSGGGKPRVQRPRVQTLPRQESSSIAASLEAGLQAFPLELVEQTRARIRAESRLLQDIVISDSWPRARLLEKEHSRITAVSEAFPPIITPSILRKCAREYYQILETGSKREPCASCGVLFETASLCQVTKEEPYISANLSYLDRCGIEEGIVTVCNECKVSLQENRAPKFSGSNFINTTLCQAYPPELEGLTYIEECVIALAHPIGAIVKLTSGGRSSGIEYRGSRGHFITFKQDPSQLLRILPSSALDLHKYVTISWAGSSKPTSENLMAFCRIRTQPHYTQLKVEGR